MEIKSKNGWVVLDGYGHSKSYRMRIPDKAMKKIKMKMQQKANWILGMTCLHRGIAPMDDIPSVTALHQDAAKEQQKINNTHQVEELRILRS